MAITRDDTLTMQAANYLEKQILSGKYPPGSKLLGTRTLSEELGVSRIIISCALDRLERKKLVIKKPSRGVYINDRLLSLNKTELFVLSYVGRMANFSYLENTLNLYHDLSYRERFNLTMRCIGWSGFNQETFQNEISKAQDLHSDVLVVGSPMLNREKVEALEKNGVPYLIIGEFEHDAPTIPVNQLYATYDAKGIEIAEYLAVSPYRRIVYFAYPEGMVNFETTLVRRLRNELKTAGKQLAIQTMEVSPEQEPDDRDLHVQSLRRLLDRGERPDLIYMIRRVDIDRIADVLAEYNLTIGKDIQILTHAHITEGSNPARGMMIHYDYTLFAQAAFARLQEIKDNPQDRKRQDVSDLVRLRISKAGRYIA